MVGNKGLKNASHDRSHSHLMDHFTSHLQEEDIRYFVEWDRLIDLEAKASEHLITKTWLVPAAEQESHSGKSASSLTINPRSLEAALLEADISRNRTSALALERSSGSFLNTPFSRLNLERGCLVVLSADTVSGESYPNKTKRIGGHLHLARGLLLSVNDNAITMRCSFQELQYLKAVIQKHHQSVKSPALFRLDKDDIATGVGTLRQNLINLFTGDSEPYERKTPDPRLLVRGARNRYNSLRDLVVRLKPPKFNLERCPDLADMVVEAIPGCDKGSLMADYATLNEDQKKAAQQVCIGNPS